MMRTTFNLGQLEWTLAGWTPYVWRQQRTIESGVSNNAEVPGISARVPGSVQGALRAAGIIPDWNVGLDARLSEWVENRHWIYTARLPDQWLSPGCNTRVRALGLDYKGWMLLNGKEIGRFEGAFVPHEFDLTPHLKDEGNTLQIVLDCPPRWLGQIGYTSQMTDWKPRYNYFWDWTSRVVQLAVWDDLLLDVTDGHCITAIDCRTTADPETGMGILTVRADAAPIDASARISLQNEGGVVREETVAVEDLRRGVQWNHLPVELWWPNGEGAQPLYQFRCILLDPSGETLDERSLRLGFKSLTWTACEGAPPDADPWLCVVNGRPVFCQGVNWTPIRPNFADVTDDDYRRLLETYRDLGCTMLRVWGGAFLEKEVFYNLCDELGLLVWQEFPLSSSGLENWPPDDADAIEEMGEIARSYIERRRHHVSLAVWCGGNELQTNDYRPVDERHPMIAHLRDVVVEHDPEHRFLPTSPSGPRFGADEQRFGQGEHWDVHGPWHVKGDLESDWRRYWDNNDALFHSEVGVAGASSVEIIRAYKGDLPELPGTTVNPLWRRTSWWIDWPTFERERGREPDSLEEFVAWSQERQRRAIEIAVEATKARFPRCGGFLLWMGHDSFPCTANTSIIDFHGALKPAAVTLGALFRAGTGRGASAQGEEDTNGKGN